MTALSKRVASVPVWLLRGETDRPVVCLVDGGGTKAWSVRVIRADESLLCETYPDRSSAMKRADQIRSSLIDKGWRYVSATERPMAS
jgi:hypothetical protein